MSQILCVKNNPAKQSAEESKHFGLQMETLRNKGGLTGPKVTLLVSS